MSTTTAPACPDAAKPATHVAAGPGRTPILALGALGVVFGDIGTSPLYAFKESLKAATHGGAPVGEAAIGMVSLVLWTVMAIVTLKYVVLILRADNHGEGGTLTLMALAIRSAPRAAGTCAVLGILGAALFYGDAVITPAISVLSAMEGLKLVAPSLGEYVIPGSVAVIVALFAMQSWGTAAVARWFGPVMALWFALLAVAAVPHVLAEPRILAALDPTRGLSFLLSNGGVAFLALGSVFLAVTGGEALYATWATSGARPSAWPGPSWCCPRSA